MFELLMLLMFFGVFFFVGLTFFGFFVAFAAVFALSIVVSLLGAAFNLLPYIIIGAIIYGLFRYYRTCS
ncbi:hypothetical protein A9264_11140 [Vibrio sp. UCD-FRSSP16_10]|uniref:hypothetical protein n=1 Tax=unclassified Vibrio TaxID=2614977 RepID=UPI0007FC206B|nr:MULTISPECIES: hypothetical protein [unclassified Vibrio]OBT16370.1 hypothetical protein A9260_11360 [Vibrio sp. UCD-FRSSP16_30]OBT21234.1 hypothetical protein A9264_11140 [Vibrio sp. UCD-FRSSP16_10]